MASATVSSPAFVGSKSPARATTQARKATRAAAITSARNAASHGLQRKANAASFARSDRLQVRASRSIHVIKAAAAAQEDVQVEEISNQNAHISLKVTLSAEFCKQAWNGILDDAMKQSSVPGYRKGAKIPHSILIGYLGGKQEVQQLAVERALRDSLPKALASVESEAITDSERIESNSEELINSFSVDKPFSYQVGVDLPARVEFTSAYKDMKVSVPSCSSAESQQEQIEALIMQARKDQGSLRIVQGRGMQPGDSVVIDLELFQAGTGEAIEGAARKGYQIDTGKPGLVFLPGIIEGMKGMEATGENERTITIKFPESWDSPPQFAGQTMDAKIKLKELFEYDLAPETDEFAGTVYQGVSSMADLREKLTTAVQLEAKGIDMSRADSALTEEMVKIIKADLPFSIIQNVAQQKYQSKIMEMANKGQIAPEVVEQLATPEMLQNYINTNREEIEATAKAMLGIETIFAAEKMTVSVEEKLAYIKDAVEDMEREGIEYDKEEMLAQAEDNLMTEKTLKWLRENCAVEMLPFDPEVEANL